MDIPYLVVLQRVAQLNMYIGHIRKRDSTRELIQIKMEYAELLIGRGKFPLEYPDITGST